MLWLLQLSVMAEGDITYKGKDLYIDLFNPRVFIEYDLGVEYLPIQITFQNETKVQRYVHNKQPVVSENETTGAIVADSKIYFLIDGHIRKIEPYYLLDQISSRASVGALNIDMYVGANQIQHLSTVHEYFTSFLFTSCKLTRTTKWSTTDTIELHFTNNNFLIPGSILVTDNIIDYEFLQLNSCIKYNNAVFENLKNLKAGVYNFATPGLNLILQSDTTIPLYSRIHICGLRSNLTQIEQEEQPDYVNCSSFQTPFLFNLTNQMVGKLEFIAVKSVMLGQAENFKTEQVYIDNIENNDTGFKHRHVNSCIRIWQSVNTEVQVTFTKPNISNPEPLLTYKFMDEETEEQFYTSGYICGADFQFLPIKLVDVENTELMRTLCTINNQQNRNGDFLQEKCSDYVFIETYAIYLGCIMCIFCIICLIAFLVNNTVINKISFRDSYSINIFAIMLIVSNLFCAILDVTCNQPTVVAIPVLGTVVIMIYGYVQTTQTEGYDETIFNNYQLTKHLEKLKMTPGFIISLIVGTILQLCFTVLSIILYVSDVFQMLEFFKVNVEAAEQSIIILPSLYILDMISALLNINNYIMLPFLFLFLIVQTLTRSEKFQSICPKISPDASKYIFDWRSFGVKILFNIWGFYSSFIALLLTQFSINVFSLETSPSTAQVIGVFIFSSYLYSLTKYTMIKAWGISFYRTLRGFFADLGVFFLLFAHWAWTLIGLITGPFMTCTKKCQKDVLKAYAFLFVQFLKVTGFLLIQPLIWVGRLAMFFMLPVFIFLADFTPPFNFIILAFGVMATQEEYRNVYSNMVTEPLPSVILRFFLYVASYAIITLIIFVQQDLAAWGYCQIFSVSFLLIFAVRYWTNNSQYDIMSKKTMTFNEHFKWYGKANYAINQVLQVANQATDVSQCSFEFQNIHANYMHPVPYLKTYLSDQVLNCYGFIPGVGPLLGTFSEYLNAPSLVEDAELKIPGSYFLNYVRFGMTLATVMISNAYPTHWYQYACLCVYLIFCFMSSYDEMCELTNHENIRTDACFVPCQKIRVRMPGFNQVQLRHHANTHVINQIYIQKHLQMKAKSGTANNQITISAEFEKWIQ